MPIRTRPFLRRLALLALIFMLALQLPVATPGSAQEPTVDGQPAEQAQPQVVSDPAFPDAAVAVDAPVEELDRAPDLAAQPESAPPAIEAAPANGGTVVAGTEVAPVVALSPNAVTIDVSVQETVRASEFITYTYAYVNNGGSATTSLFIDATWASFNYTNNNSALQYCTAAANLGCGLIAESVEGPAVAYGASITSGIRYSVGSLAPGASGQFKVVLRTLKSAYPKTGQALSRPSGSAYIYVNGEQAPSGNDTANSLIIGPVFVISKIAAPNFKIYPLQTATFTITLGNATAAADKAPDGSIRIDATTATNVVLNDVIPTGGEFVSATGNPTLTNGNTQLTWTIASLAPGQSVSFQIVFRKLDVNLACGTMSNSIYNVTSNEMPFNTTTRYIVSGPSVSVTVVTPLVVKSITANPSSVYFGGRSTLTIVVQNFWPAALTGAQLHYDIQSNAYFVAGSTVPTAGTTPNPSLPGGRVTWSFNIAAGTLNTATEATFVLEVDGGYDAAVSTGTGQAQVLPPAGSNVPAACSVAKAGRVNLLPRLIVNKTTPADPETLLNNNYIVQRGQEFPYTISIENKGTVAATGVQIKDNIPSEPGANFSFKVGSSFIDGAPRPPDTYTDGPGGIIVWENLTIQPGETLTIEYMMYVNGLDYQAYCNLVTATLGTELITYPVRKVCVKINPQIIVTKVANKSTAQVNEEIQFTLSMTNNEPVSYTVALYDKLGSFEYVRSISTYGGSDPVYNATAKTLTWAMITLGPGQRVEAVFVGKISSMTLCASTDYDNEVLFLIPSGIIQPVPPVKARVRVTAPCSRIDYSKSVSRTTASLRDRVTYTLNVKNSDTNQAATNVVVTDVLPLGFEYVGIEGSSQVLTPPTVQTRADGRVSLQWLLPSLGINTQKSIKFIARTGNVVGQADNWLVASAPGRTSNCTAGSTNCVTITENGVQTTYARVSVNVQTLITMEPKIMETSCAVPNNLRTYKLTIANTNDHAYTQTAVSVTLPFGLTYVNAINGTAIPQIQTLGDGTTVLIWKDMTILAKPSGSFAYQLDLEVQLRVGNTWGNLKTLVQTTSPDGAIPRKDGVDDPTIQVCPGTPAVAKHIERINVWRGGEAIFRIVLVNPNPTATTVTIADALPTGLVYAGMISGPNPSINGSTLTWSVTLPPATSSSSLGEIVLHFRTRVGPTMAYGVYLNRAAVTQSQTAFNQDFNGVPFNVWRGLFAPLIRR